MLTFSVGLLILGLAVGLLGVMLDEVYSWGGNVAGAGVIMCSVWPLLALLVVSSTMVFSHKKGEKRND